MRSLCLTHLVRIEHIHGCLCPRPCPIPEFCLGIFFPYVKVKDMIVAGPVIFNDRQSIRFVESYACKRDPVSSEHVTAMHVNTYRSNRRNWIPGDTRGRFRERGISLRRPPAQQLRLWEACWRVAIDGGHTRVR